MVSTVTISTITIIAASSIVVGIGIFATLLLVGFLSTRELLHANGGARQKLLARSLLVGIIPLLIGFIVIVALKVAEILA
jgi:hypothetical protein